MFTISTALILGVGYYLINKVNPRVLRNRTKVKNEGLTFATKKSAGSDRIILPTMSIGFFGALLLPSFGHRFDWTELPFWLTTIGLLISCSGTVVMRVSMVQNVHASKILDINQEQQLVDTGLYGKVRHPLYSGAIWMILGLLIALESLWRLIPALIACASLIWRIQYEEDMLLKGMDGYAAYRERVRYKLFPGIY